MMQGCVIATHEWRVSDDSQQVQREIADKIVELCIGWGRQIGQNYPSQWDGRPLYGPRRLSVDDSGSNAVSELLLAKNIDCDRVNFGAGPSGDWGVLVRDMQFLNLRAEMAWVARRGLQEGYFQVPQLPEFAALWDQCQWTQYDLQLKDGIWHVRLEPKEKVKERHNGKSPDYADAFWLACRSGLGSMSAAMIGGPNPQDLTAAKGAEERIELRVGPDTPALPRTGPFWKPGAGWK